MGSAGQSAVASALARKQLPAVFQWGQGGEMLSPEEVKSRRARAEAMRHPAGYTPKGWFSLLGALAGEGVAKYKSDEADRAEKTGHAKVAEALAAARQNGDYMSVLGDEWATPQQAAVAQALQSRAWSQEDQAKAWAREDARAAAARAAAAAEGAKPKWMTLESGGDTYRWNANDPDSKPMLFFDGPNAPPEPPKIEETFDPVTGRPIKKQWAGEAGWQDFGGVAAPNDPLVTVNTGDAPDGALNKALSTKEGESWAGLKDAGMVAGGLGQDLGILDELMKVAPQGPIVGPLAETFKGFSSAGDAFQSIVKRVAPSLRTPGSGATSDIEYEGFLQSLPALKNASEANVMINSIMKSKAALNVQRADIITAYQNGDMTVGEARSKLSDLNKVSIITPDMKKALLGVGAGAGDTPALPQVGEVVDGFVYQGGDPSNPTSWKQQ